MSHNEPLRTPYLAGFPATPEEGSMFVMNNGLVCVYTGGAWRDVGFGTATKLQTARTISLTGDASGSTTFDGSANASIAVPVNNAHPIETNLSTQMAVVATSDYQNTIGQNVWTQLSFNQVHANDNSMFDGGGTIYLNTSGFYLITAMVRFEADTDAGRRLMDLRVNGGYRRQYGFGATNSGQWGRGCTVITHSGGSVNTQVWAYAENPGKNMRIYRAQLAVWKISKWNGDGDTP